MEDASASSSVGVPSRPGWDLYDAAIILVAAIATFSVHGIHRRLTQPYSLDEAWVADLTRMTWSRMLGIGAPVPTGFVALLRLVPGSGQERGRLVVLGFSILSVLIAYVLARSLRWETKTTSRAVALTAAAVVMLAPVSLNRNDLKQYTCDACCALVLLALGARSDRVDSPARLYFLGVVAVLLLPFSWTSVFVSVAMFTGLLASALLAGDRGRARRVLVVGTTTGVASVGYFAAFVIPNLDAKLTAYWQSTYLSGSPLHMATETWDRFEGMGRRFGIPAVVFGVLFALGIVVLFRMRERALAVAVPVLWVEMLVAGRLHKYPFLDVRTSQFLWISSFVIVAIGTVGLVRVSGRRHWAAAVAVALCLAIVFAVGIARNTGGSSDDPEDVRSQAVWISTHYRKNDVILVNQAGDFGFAYYWPGGHLRFRKSDNSQGFAVEVAGIPAIYVPDRTYPAILASLREAVNRLRARDTFSRMFIVRTHLSTAEDWQQAFTTLGLHARRVAVGKEPLYVVRMAAIRPGSG